MIGVISDDSERATAGEFFELFKTPWEFYEEGKFYDVVLTTRDCVVQIESKALLIYSSARTRWDLTESAHGSNHMRGLLLESEKGIFPIFGSVATFQSQGRLLVWAKGIDGAAGVEIQAEDQKVFRIGFDLFQEITHLLSFGQPAKYAHIPTLEMHISMLRDWILSAGVPLAEIPPVPAGYDFAVCLTHDIDFAAIRNHIFNHTFFGFINRALLVSLKHFLQRRTSWSKLKENYKAVLSLPAVYLGLANDLWGQFDRYVDMEKGLGSTFFLVPFKDRPGRDSNGRIPKRRAVRYDITEVQPQVQVLLAKGAEVALHGIDAWRDAVKGREEFERVYRVVEDPNIGVRMHWLFFSEESPKLLEEAGFVYDSSYGYNDAIGFRGGTNQVFRPLGASRLLELPLHIQDTALFFPRRMNLTDEKALKLILDLLRNMEIHGGVVTINWHDRSLVPERQWGDFYLRLIEELKARKAWFGTAGQIVKWFNRRRSAQFEESKFVGNTLNLKVTSAKSAGGPDLLMRIHKSKDRKGKDRHSENERPIEIAFSGNFEAAISL
jgi:hypothetical protein